MQVLVEFRPSILVDDNQVGSDVTGVMAVGELSTPEVVQRHFGASVERVGCLSLRLAPCYQRRLWLGASVEGFKPLPIALPLAGRTENFASWHMCTGIEQRGMVSVHSRSYARSDPAE